MKRKHTLIIPLLALLAIHFAACGNSKNHRTATDATPAETRADVHVPAFNADSAYQYVKAQCDFGPRVPNTQAHRDCGEYLFQKLRQFGARMYDQHADVIAYDNTVLKARNIIASFNPDNRRRVLLCAHWDSRPYADEEEDEAEQRKPILGANDGASGVGILLEVARQLQQQAPAIGIDIVLFDAEDYGTPYFYQVLLRGILAAHGRQVRQEDLGRRPPHRFRQLLPPPQRLGSNGRPPVCVPAAQNPLRGHHQLRPQRLERLRRLLAHP